MNTIVVLISGKARSGKDSLFSYLKPFGFERLSFADALKAKVKAEFGLSEEQVNGSLKDWPCPELNGLSPRQVLIDYGNLRRKYNPNYWVNIVAGQIDMLGNNRLLAITDVRYPNEISVIADLVDVSVVKVRLERHPLRDGLSDPAAAASVSETALDSYEGWDYTLPAQNNRTLSQLELLANHIAYDLRLPVPQK